MSWIRRREIPLVLCSSIVLVFIAAFFLEIPILDSVTSDLNSWDIIIISFSMLVGGINIVMIRIREIQRNKDTTVKALNVWLLLLMSFFTIFGLLPPMTLHPTFTLLFETFYTPINSAVYSLLAFYITSAAFRAFKGRTFYTSVFLISGVLMMLYNAPLGGAVWPGFISIGNWIIEVPSMAAQRGVAIGIGIGILGTTLRTILARETSWLGKEMTTEERRA